MRLTDFLARIRDSLKRADRAAGSGGEALISNAFVKAFGRCPICDQEFVDHYFTLLGVIPAGQVEAVKDLINKVKNHQWLAAKEVQKFEPSEDALEVHVLRCAGGRLAAVIIEDPFELYFNPRVVEYEVLDDAQSQDLKAVVGEARWRSVN